MHLLFHFFGGGLGFRFDACLIRSLGLLDFGLLVIFHKGTLIRTSLLPLLSNGMTGARYGAPNDLNDIKCRSIIMIPAKYPNSPKNAVAKSIGNLTSLKVLLKS